MGYTYKSRTYIPEDILEKMPQLNRGVYFAVQRVLQTIWFGGPSPIDEAITWTLLDRGEEVDKQRVENELVEFINLLIRRLPSLQDAEALAPFISYRAQGLSERLTRGLPRIEELRSQIAPVEDGVIQLEHRVRELRKRYTYLSSQEKNLQRKILEMEEREQAVQKGLERISKLSPVEVKKCLEIAQALINQPKEGTEGKEKESI